MFLASSRRPLVMVLLACASTMVANAAISEWYTSATGTSNNIVASTGGSGGGQTGANGGGWLLDGTGGVAFDYGNLSVGYNSSGTNTGNNAYGASYATLEFVFNLSGSTASNGSITLGSFRGYGSGSTFENYALKLQQGSSSVYGITSAGVRDAKFNSAPSTVGAYTHVAFVLSTNTWNIYVNGVSMGQDSTPNNWRLNGGTGLLGAFNSTSEFATGTVYSVATYDRALTSAEVSANYNQLMVVPEASTYAWIGVTMLIGGVALVTRRRKH
ncbi:MAG: LamG domain-containing protein [Puniceicoccales bacterium]|nr:LamG domain-containing protein [Puniceicoccales bacterium]